jgi:hypothetical protein
MECVIVNKRGVKENTLDCEYMFYPYGEQGVIQYQPQTELGSHRTEGYILMSTAHLDETVDVLVAVGSEGSVSLKTVTGVQHVRHEFITNKQKIYYRIEFSSGRVKYEPGYVLGARTDDVTNKVWNTTIDELKSVKLIKPEDSALKQIAAKKYKREIHIE